MENVGKKYGVLSRLTVDDDERSEPALGLHDEASETFDVVLHGVAAPARARGAYHS